ncbi:C1 family peptidase [Microbacterium sp.]|uniref:C1 family peptidase n=1 Tax=Microbacterium sp. TaxID=51671 RepID=UPI003A8E4E4F
MSTQSLKTYGDVRALIAQHDLGWRVLPSIPDNAPLVRRLLGGPPPKPADPARRVDVLKLVAAHPSAAQLALAPSPGPVPGLRPPIPTPLPPIPVPAPPARPAAVDWRTHNGWPIFTRTRDQFDSEHCWIFAPTGIIEAMTRIEHCTWAPRSEGDVVRGLSVIVGQCGDAVNTLNWVKNNGQADPGCIPWPFPAARNDAYWVPGPTKCGTGSTQHTTATTTFDRSGRTVKIPAFTTLSHVDDMKNWIWQVGPTVASSITIYDDFYGYSDISTVYKAAPNQTSNGTHVVDVVGFDDNKQAWLIRNSWGGTPGGDDWGDHGYGWIGYGQIDIDTNVMYGVRGTNPDPWAKRFNHNGAMFESGDGANHDNFELFVHAPAGGGIAHWWRDNGTGSLPWAQASGFANDAASEPTATGTTYNRNFETIYTAASGRLRHWWFDQTHGTWNDGATFGPANAMGTPGFVQSTYGANFEVVAGLASGQLQHWWRDGGGWHAGPVFGANVREAGPSLIQTTKGDLELVCLRADGTLQHWARADGTTWAWSATATFASGCRTAPVMIEGQYGRSDEFASGNYELVVALASGVLQHWWRDSAGVWRASATFGTGIERVLALVQSSFGFDLEVVARRHDGRTQHFWRDGTGWHDGVIIEPSL